ncbi:MAG: hypothetical protein U1E76_16450 [Planctomycetota bacterium]
MAASPDVPHARRRRVCLLALVLLATLTVLLWMVQPVLTIEPALEFQTATGGFGLGASSEPSWCLHALDPRRESTCPTAFRPVPGLVPYCPRETLTLSCMPDPAGLDPGAAR